MRQITSASEKITKKNIINRISDIPGGISILLATLVVGRVVQEATPLTAPASGKRTVCKQAKILAGSTTTAIKVEELTHHFKVGEFIGTKLLGKAYAITSIDNAAGVDTLNVGTAIDTPTTGDFIYEMAAEAASNTSALENTPEVIVKSPFEVPSLAQVIWMGDALMRADVAEASIGSVYRATLDVNEIKY